MAKLLVYYAHPGHQHSRVNRKMAEIAERLDEVTYCDLYHRYPRYNIDIEYEQEMLIHHDVILFQHPLFWYSTPALIKEWIDLVLEHGFAFGAGGDKLTGKTMMNATTAAGPEEAYRQDGYQHYPLRTFLTPLEQTARLCHMQYCAPYVLYSALDAEEDREIAEHVKNYELLLRAIVEDRFDFFRASQASIMKASDINHYVESK